MLQSCTRRYTRELQHAAKCMGVCCSNVLQLSIWKYRCIPRLSSEDSCDICVSALMYVVSIHLIGIELVLCDVLTRVCDTHLYEYSNHQLYDEFCFEIRRDSNPRGSSPRSPKAFGHSTNNMVEECALDHQQHHCALQCVAACYSTVLV